MAATAQTPEIFCAHGGKIAAARAAFPDSRLPWIDLSTGISPWSYPHEPLQRADLTRLPDVQALADLEFAAARYFRVGEAARVIALPGSDLGLRLMGDRFAQRSVAVVRPGYSGHVLAWRGRTVTPIPAADLRQAATTHDVIVLANPNNPDGRLIERQRLLETAEELSGRTGTLVVDEAFADLLPEHSVCNAVAEGLAVFRSFGKFFGLAGVRLGFLIVAAALEREFRGGLGDWPLTGPAIVIGTAAYRDRAWQELQRKRLHSAAARLDALLTEAGLTVVGGTALFRLVRHQGAGALFRRLAADSILTRPFTSDPALLRVGLPGDEADWERLAVALQGGHSP